MAAMNTSLSRLQSFYGELSAPLLLHATIKREFPGNVAVLTSGGSGAALLLAMVAQIDPAIPVLFLNTGKHFGETREYVHSLARFLGLGDMREIAPDPAKAALQDPHGDRWRTAPVACCRLRKAEPLAGALEAMGLLALITGRGAARRIELDENGVFRINPLAAMTKEAQKDEMTKRALPPHPLESRNYAAIGCESCTLQVHRNDGDAGVWALAAGLEEGAGNPETPAYAPSASDWSV